MENSKKTSCACSNQNSLKKAPVKGGKKMSVLGAGAKGFAKSAMSGAKNEV